MERHRRRRRLGEGHALRASLRDAPVRGRGFRQRHGRRRPEARGRGNAGALARHRSRHEDAVLAGAARPRRVREPGAGLERGEHHHAGPPAPVALRARRCGGLHHRERGHSRHRDRERLAGDAGLERAHARPRLRRRAGHLAGRGRSEGRRRPGSRAPDRELRRARRVRVSLDGLERARRAGVPVGGCGEPGRPPRYHRRRSGHRSGAAGLQLSPLRPPLHARARVHERLHPVRQRRRRVREHRAPLAGGAAQLGRAVLGRPALWLRVPARLRPQRRHPLGRELGGGAALQRPRVGDDVPVHPLSLG